ncbi:hypothetical protein Q8F55_007445 [Vanrija albida]|uniref:Uncharacterized protein n=1 Tax=Vanrija albida TaxID=181172 RepID=A0ABR3PUF7_9TREE
MNPDPARPFSAPEYLFSSLPPRTELNAAQMAEIGCGLPVYKVSAHPSYTGFKYPAPPHLVCERCRQPPGGMCWIMGLRVAEYGGFFSMRVCHACTGRAKCSATTHRKLVYIAFVDKNTAVWVDKGTKRVLEVARSNTSARLPINFQSQPHAKLRSYTERSTVRLLEDPRPYTTAAAARSPSATPPVDFADCEVVREILGHVGAREKLADGSLGAGATVFHHAPSARDRRNPLTTERARVDDDTAVSEWDWDHLHIDQQEDEWEAERGHDDNSQDALEAERRTHTEQQAAWAAEREYNAQRAAMWADERQRHADKEAAWGADGVQHAADRAALDHERAYHAETRAQLAAERGLHAEQAAAWEQEKRQIIVTLQDENRRTRAAWRDAERAFLLNWQEAMNNEQRNAALWNAERQALLELIAVLEASGVDNGPDTGYLFGSLPKDTELDAAQMEHLGYGEPTHYKCRQEHHTGLKYPAPSHLACKQCREPGGGECRILTLRVAEEGGYFSMGICHTCIPLNAKCTASSLMTGAYIAFVDKNTAVWVDKKSKKVRRVASANGSGGLRINLQYQPGAEPNPAVAAQPSASTALLAHSSPATTMSELTPLPSEDEEETCPSVTMAERSPSTTPPVDFKDSESLPPASDDAPPAASDKVDPSAERARFDEAFAMWDQQRQHFAKQKDEWAAERQYYIAQKAACDAQLLHHNQQTAAERRHHDNQREAERRHHNLQKAAWEAERRRHVKKHDDACEAKHQRHAEQKAAWELERQHYLKQADEFEAQRRTHAEVQAAWKADCECHDQQAGLLADERERHAAVVKALADEQERHSAHERGWDYETQRHADAEAALLEMNRRLGVGLRAEQANFAARWQAVVQSHQHKEALWVAERQGLNNRIALLEGVLGENAAARVAALHANAVKDRAALLDRLEVAERALAGVRAAAGARRMV